MIKKVICISLLALIFFGVLVFTLLPPAPTCGGPGPTYPSFYFWSVEEFLMFFEENVQTGVIPAVEENKINYRPEREEISATYTAFVNQMVVAPVIYMPTHNQEMIPFENKEGFYNIDLYPRWTYELPWIRYSLLNENGPLTIELLYLDSSVTEKVNQEVAENKELQKKEIVLADRTVSAFIEEKDDNRIKIYFTYDEIYVAVWAQPEVITDQWLKGLSFSKYTSEQWFAQTVDDIVCNNEVFLDLQSNRVKTVGYYNEFASVCGLGSESGFVYKEDLTYAFIKLLKEEPLYETTSNESHDSGNVLFVLVLRNGERRNISFVVKEMQYNGHTYTGFSHNFAGRLQELFEL